MATITVNDTIYRVGPHLEPVPLPAWLPTVLPAPWQEIQTAWGRKAGRAYARSYRHRTGLLVLVSAAQYGDAKAWLHVSVSRSDHALPSWQTMSQVKNLLIGDDRTALQVMPPRAKHVNIHPGVLHLYCCLDGDVTPDFTGGGDTI